MKEENKAGTLEREFLNLIDTNWQRMDGGDLVDVDPIKWLRQNFISKEKLQKVLGDMEQIETTFNVTGSDNYQIGQNHGRQEMKRTILTALLTIINNKEQ